MANLLLVFMLLTAASAAPPINDGAYRDWQKEFLDRMELSKLQEVYPAKRSNYGYVSPCAAASAPVSYAQGMVAPMQGYPSAATPYSYSHVAYQMPHAHVPPSYSHPYYRSEGEGSEQELLEFSDMDHAANHAPTARYAYAPGPMAPSAGSGGQASGPVVGVFSNANVGGCSVPLLVSCSPSIAHGRMVKTQQYYGEGAYPAQGNLYRVVEDHPPHEEIKGHQEKIAQSSEHTNTMHSKTTADKHQ